jgi:hypothetical protein
VSGATRRDAGPDFVGVGVQRAGSTWVTRVLQQHPQVWVRQKEISFFTRHYHKGWRWYEDHFADRQGRAAGEFSVNYFYAPRPHATRREFYPWWNPRRTLQFWRRLPSPRDALAARYPGLRVFVVLRDPALRAWSHYWYWRGRRTRPGRHIVPKRIVPFERMFRADGRWIATQGRYADHLAHWREAFPEMGVFFYDDLRERPAELARELYRFVGVDPAFVPNTDLRVNARDYPPMPAELRRVLVAHYREQVERLQEMVGRDLSAWLGDVTSVTETGSQTESD